MPARSFAVSLLLALNALAGEYAVLSTGAVQYADRHETSGDTIRLFVNGGSIELPTSMVLGFEKDDRPAPASPQVSSGRELSPAELVHRAAARWGLPPELVRLIAKEESGFRANAVSPKGAIGLMQLMPETARSLGADPSKPEQNVEAGVRYLRDLLLKYQDDDLQLRKALAAYNAGPGAVDRYRGVPPFQETQHYVERIIRQYKRSAAP